mgnify:FL=1
MLLLVSIIGLLVDVVVTVVIVQFVLGMLIMFNVLSMQNQFVAALYTALNAILDPILSPIRRILPDTGMIDLSPIILIVGLQILQRVLLSAV